jgi:DNA-binding GntR family transcriptional regulator
MSAPRSSRTEQADRYMVEEALRGRSQAGDIVSTDTLAHELQIPPHPGARGAQAA